MESEPFYMFALWYLGTRLLLSHLYFCLRFRFGFQTCVLRNRERIAGNCQVVTKEIKGVLSGGDYLCK